MNSSASYLTTLKPATKGKTQHWQTPIGLSSALLYKTLTNRFPSLTLIVTTDSAAAEARLTELQFFAKDSDYIELFPDLEVLPYDNFSPHQDLISQRLQTLSQMPNLKQGIIITPITTLMRRLAPTNYIQSQSLQLVLGQSLSLETFRHQLVESGYHPVTTVYEHGEFAVRGSIIDLFPMGSQHPVRIELFDDEVESIRLFDTETQRTLEKINSINMLPAKELPLDEKGIKQFRQNWHEQMPAQTIQSPIYKDVSNALAPQGIEFYLPLFFNHTSNFFDYLPKNTQVFFEGDTGTTAEHYWSEIKNRYDNLRGDTSRPLLPPVDLFLPPEQLFKEANCFAITSVRADKKGQNFSIKQGPASLSIVHKQEDPLRQVKDYCQHSGFERYLFCADSPGRRESLIQLFNEHQLPCCRCDGWHDFLTRKEKLCITVSPLAQGVELPEQSISIIAESQLFGQRVTQERRRDSNSQEGTNALDNAIRSLAELKTGDPIVHIDHGVGRYQGLETITAGNITGEFLTLLYADEAKLYVPVNALHLVGRYSGASPELAPLHRLGADQWSKARKKAAEKIRDVAAELLSIYAQRESRKGFSHTIPKDTYQSFAESFPFEETPDQQAAIKAVVNDMESPEPMDRLVCGDVGFGKTEVAMRGAFIAVNNNKQVVVLVPTTLLAQQHYDNFRDRFSDFPVNIELISRFKTAKEQKTVIENLAKGTVDIVIGTHKLLQSDMSYKKLGLLIIDEEHRFGVKQKERLKALRAEVDILTLTATPIPRTLNMALSGMRHLSIIATPPAKRLAVKTFVRESDDALIKEALLRELLRGGQVYYLHNDINTMEKVVEKIKNLVPEARPIIAHGQMRERQLERAMSDFHHKRFNVLVCTTIIENGIDIPNANTIIIDRADKFGLAQLHQLRGRVGRSHHQAYAYLLTPNQRTITRDAIKRLEAISEAGQLGAGFLLATNDLEIRGAGELLGEEQSGQINSIGYDLYMELLEKTVTALKEGKAQPEIGSTSQTEINLQMPTLIPDAYIPDVSLRLNLYKRIANASKEELKSIQIEMIDRFGLLPEECKLLFRSASLRLKASQLGIAKIDASMEKGKIEFLSETVIEPITLIELIQQQPKTYSLKGGNTLLFDYKTSTYHECIDFILTLLDKLNIPASNDKLG